MINGSTSKQSVSVIITNVSFFRKLLKSVVLVVLSCLSQPTLSFRISPYNSLRSTTASSSSSSSLVVVSSSTSSSPLFVDLTKSTSTMAPPSTTPSIQENVQEYYGTTLQTSDDLKTNACTTAGDMPKYIKQCLSKIHPDVLAKYYGCGLCIPEYDLTGTTVLDLGCGAGRDVYLLSQLVGSTGNVVGIDMTPQQLDVAKQHQQYHADTFGYSTSNVQFVQGYLEQLESNTELQTGTFDLIISNCVINLCTDKAAVLRACYKLLKPGGELYFSDVYSNRRVPKLLQDDKVLWGECLSGALYWNDFHNLAKNAGFADPRLVEDSPITVNNAAVAAAITQTGNQQLEFYSATYRLQKLDNLEPACEDYGQAVIYKGTINPAAGLQNDKASAAAIAASTWTLDKHHVFEAGKIHPVCGNTWNMLMGNTRVAPHFDFIGNFDKHYGIFEGCGSSLPYDRVSPSNNNAGSSSSGGGCCLK